MSTPSEPLAGATGSTVRTPQQRPQTDRRVRSGLRLPGATHRLATRLLAQQFWLFGWDIRRAEGNLLVEFGFQKHRPPDGSRVMASRYTCVFPDQRAVVLWGFGLYWHDPALGGMYLPRSAFSPLVRTCTELPSDAWDPDHIDGLAPARTVLARDRRRILLLDALGWIREYERAVAALAGIAYRSQAVQGWKRPCGAAIELPSQWQGIIDAVAAIPCRGAASSHHPTR
jgi:hypothetical protein